MAARSAIGRHLEARSEVWNEVWILAATWVLSALYVLAFVDRGWIAGDEGMLGQSAERVLRGELPHVDFQAIYTGGLAAWNALAFRVLGVDLLSIRWFLFGATLLFVPAVFRIARRVAGPGGAAAATLAAVAWSVPNYFAGMPSWYNLFLATFGILALLRFVETGQRRWLAAAGLLSGVSFLVKSTGLLFVASVLLFLVFREQEQALTEAGDARHSDGASALGFRLFATAGLGAFVVVLGGFFAQRPGVMDILHFVVPGASLAVFLAVRVWAEPSGQGGARLRRLLADGAVYGGAALAPVGVFAIPYLARGVFLDWLGSGFLFQSSRLEFGVWVLPIPATLVCALPVALLFAWPFLRRHRDAVRDPVSDEPSDRGRLAAVGAALLAAVVLSLGTHALVYQTVWLSLRPLVPIVVLAGLGVLVTEARGRGTDPIRRQQLFLVLAVVALASIFQFPYARAIYFCYIAALVLLAWLFVAASQRGAPRRVHAVVGGFYTLFALLWLNLGWIETMERGFRPLDHSFAVDLERADRLRIDARTAGLYGELIPIVQEHSAPGDAVYAGPDCPEIYFLAARRNPTPTLLDFLDEDFGTPARTDRLLRTLEAEDIDVVVLRRIRVFSPLDERLVAAVEARYPETARVGEFSVHWREPPG